MNKLLKSSIAAGIIVFMGFSGMAQEVAGSSKLVSDDVLLWVLVGTIMLLGVVNVVLSGTIKGLSSDNEIWKVAKDRIKSKGAGVLIFLLMINGFTAQAQGGAAGSSFVMGDDLFYALITMIVLMLLLIYYQINVLRGLLKTIRGEEVVEANAIESWAAALTDVVPIEQEESIMFEHEHDGIRELDNNLPPWWLWGFYITIAFVPIYIAYYHFGSGPSSLDEYNMEMAEAAEAKAAYMAGLSNLIDETNVELDLSEAGLASGKKIFIDNCAACHGQSGEGGVGPNVTDEYWIHGGGVKEVFSTIKYGVPTKGMIPWEAQLSPSQMKDVTNYILSLKGSNPPGAKEPQGEIWNDESVDGTEAAPSVESPVETAPSEPIDKPKEATENQTAG
ncbi:MAG: c-type cytochrome [Flavobacteriales bacterium]|nr:c-type cytochrome [Flavobacteriales bacterium]